MVLTEGGAMWAQDWGLGKVAERDQGRKLSLVRVDKYSL